MGRKKSALKEIISKAKYVDDPSTYIVYYRDFDEIVTLKLSDFFAAQEEFSIPLHRITLIKHDGKPVYVKPGFCATCGKKIEYPNHCH